MPRMYMVPRKGGTDIKKAARPFSGRYETSRVCHGKKQGNYGGRKNMTMKELQELTDRDFEIILYNMDGTICCAGPLPGKYGKGLHYVSESGRTCLIDGEIEQWENAWNTYIADLIWKKEKAGRTRHNRTRKQAEKMGAITNMPTWIALPTLKEYQNALSTTIKKNSLAYLQPITKELASNLNFENGKLYFFGSDASNVDFSQYYDNRQKKLDLSTLLALYSVILQEVEDTAKDANKIISQVNDPQYLSYKVKIYLPEFLKMLGYKQNLSNDGIESVVDKIRSYSRIIGVIKKSYDARKSRKDDYHYYPVMQLVEHNKEENTVQIFSPYINKLIMTILKASIQMDKEGNPKLKGNGQPFLMPSHSHLVKSSISKERGKGAVEIVCVVVVLIEQAGKRTPHIKVKTIVDRCPRLKNSFDSAATSSDKGKVLKRAFKRAWELLPQQTRLAEVYKNIKFPTFIPAACELDKVLEFPHEGKNESV